MTDEQLAKLEKMRDEVAISAAAEIFQHFPEIAKDLREARHLLREAYNELNTIDAITVSPSDTDGLIELLRRIREHLGDK